MKVVAWALALLGNSQLLMHFTAEIAASKIHPLLQNISYKMITYTLRRYNVNTYCKCETVSVLVAGREGEKEIWRFFGLNYVEEMNHFT